MPEQIGRWNQARGVWEAATADLLSERSEPFSATWPNSGTTRDGVAWRQPTPVLRTAGSGSSSSRGPGRPTAADEAPTSPDSRGPLLKTPTAQLATNGGSQHPTKRKAGGHGPTLADEVEHLLPTPTSTNQHGNSQNGRGELLLPGVAASLFPTPTAGIATGGNTSRSGDRKGEPLLPGIARRLHAETVSTDPTPVSTEPDGALFPLDFGDEDSSPPPSPPPAPSRLLPTPNASVANEGETEETWEARRRRVKEASGANNGMPLSIAVQRLGKARLLPTPTAADSQQSGGSSPVDVTLTDAVVRTDLGRKPNPRHSGASSPKRSRGGKP